MTTATTTASMDMDETLEARTETVDELLARMDADTTDAPGFRALVLQLAELNGHLADMGFNGTSN
jgi:hypothetical protein